jgi:2-polyprenyl-3-methyl-5-hydroxy-6-metoxy-1,4-benzoquinol methylase
MTDASNTRFNAEARSWDSNPSVRRATALAHAAYLARLPPPSVLSTYDVLDLGCGTGLLSLALAPSVRSVTAVDAAEGMIVALQAKLDYPSSSSLTENEDTGAVDTARIKNVRAVHALLQSPSDPRLAIDPVTGAPWSTTRSTSTAALPDSSEGGGSPFDLAVSHLVLHHVPDLPSFFRVLHGCLKPGGRVMVTDFEDFGPEARKFHPESKMDGVERHGIRSEETRGLLEGAGFVDVLVERAFEMEKEVETEPGSGVLGPMVVFPFLICTGRKGA